MFVQITVLTKDWDCTIRGKEKRFAFDDKFSTQVVSTVLDFLTISSTKYCSIFTFVAISASERIVRRENMTHTMSFCNKCHGKMLQKIKGWESSPVFVFVFFLSPKKLDLTRVSIFPPFLNFLKTRHTCPYFVMGGEGRRKLIFQFHHPFSMIEKKCNLEVHSRFNWSYLY